MRIAAPAFIQDPLTLDVVLNAPALTHQGIALARDRLRHFSRKRTIHHADGDRANAEGALPAKPAPTQPKLADPFKYPEPSKP